MGHVHGIHELVELVVALAIVVSGAGLLGLSWRQSRRSR